VTATPAERSLQGRLAAAVRWAHVDDRAAATKPGRDGRWRQFEDQVDPDRVLDPAERARRAELAQKAHMTRMSLAAARKRRRRRERKTA
jgi:hypothetical protein